MAIRDFKSTRKTASTARPAISKIPLRTSHGSYLKDLEVQTTPICEGYWWLFEFAQFEFDTVAPKRQFRGVIVGNEVDEAIENRTNDQCVEFITHT